MAFNHAKHESMAKVVKLQEKASEVIFNKLWSRHVYKTNIRMFIHSFYCHCHDSAFLKHKIQC